MRSENSILRGSYPNRGKRASSRRKKDAGASLGFCWGFGVVVCLTFGLASFLMFSAGHFDSFSSGLGGVEAAHGGVEENLTYSRGLLDIEVIQLSPSAYSSDTAELYAQADGSRMIDDFGVVLIRNGNPFGFQLTGQV